jgi:hypothetical protein
MMNVNNEVGRIWKEAVWGYSEILLQRLLAHTFHIQTCGQFSITLSIRSLHRNLSRELGISSYQLNETAYVTLFIFLKTMYRLRY